MNFCYSNPQLCLHLIIGISSFIAIISSPLIALYVSARITEKRRKRYDKIMIFKELMAYKKNQNQLSQSSLARALNLIDIVFAGDKNILKNFYILRNALRAPVSLVSSIGVHFVVLLKSIAVDLDYQIEEQNLDLCLGFEDLKRHAEPYQK